MTEEKLKQHLINISGHRNIVKRTELEAACGLRRNSIYQWVVLGTTSMSEEHQKRIIQKLKELGEI